MTNRSSCVLLLLAALLVPLLRAAPDTGDFFPTLKAGHPRLLLRDFESLKPASGAEDPLRQALRENIIAAAGKMLEEPTTRHEIPDGLRLLFQSRIAFQHITTTALAYRLTGDTRFRDRAVSEMLAAASFPDWNPRHFLDVGEMSAALALGYDWLHDAMSPEERATVRKALMEKALHFGPSAYTGEQAWWAKSKMNWNQVCNSGLLAAALALADEEPEAANIVVQGAIKSLPLAQAAYEPDGAYPEGPQYWNYGTTYHVLACAMLESALGSDYGLSDSPGLRKTTLYRLQMQSPSYQSFNYADGTTHLGFSPAYTWLAQHFGPPLAVAHARALLARQLYNHEQDDEVDRFLPLSLLWFPRETPGDDAGGAEAALDEHFRGGADLAVFRSGWNDPDALYLGFKNGSNAVSHSHLDLGSFVLEADGVRWSVDPGRDNYNLPGYFDAKPGGRRWTYFRLTNLCHSTLTPGQQLQDPEATASITAYASTPARAFAISDLTAAYPGAARSIRRGITLLDRARVLVQDEVEGATDSRLLSWRMMTGAKIDLSADGREAKLTQDGRTLVAHLLAPAGPEARFTVLSAAPPTPAENQNKDIRILALEVPASSRLVRLAVLLSPEGPKWRDLPSPTVMPLEEWK